MYYTQYMNTGIHLKHAFMYLTYNEYSSEYTYIHDYTQYEYSSWVLVYIHVFRHNMNIHFEYAYMYFYNQTDNKKAYR